jgi:uncharacterized membrane protein
MEHREVPMEDHNVSGLAPKRAPLRVASALSLVGIGVAAYQTWIKLRLQHDPEFKSSCNVGEALNCDAVMTSAWSEIAGIPISLLAIPTYLVVLYFLSLALRGALERGRSFAPSLAKRALRNAFVLGLATVGYSIFLFFISKVKLETYCIFCIALYVVNIGSTVAIAMARRESLPDMLRGWFGDLIAIRPPILSSLTVVMLSSVVDIPHLIPDHGRGSDGGYRCPLHGRFRGGGARGAERGSCCGRSSRRVVVERSTQGAPDPEACAPEREDDRQWSHLL